MKENKSVPIYLLLVSVIFTGSANSSNAQSLQTSFDILGPTVQQITNHAARKIHYIDDGNVSGLPVVFIGGLGTSVRVIRLLDFLRTMREEQNLRFITIERNGFGQTEFTESLTMADYSEDVELVLAHLNIEKFALFGISGGGPYAAKIAERNPDRLLSVHMAATSPGIINPDRCAGEAENPYFEMLGYPMQFFAFAEASPLHQIEGFQDTAFDEAARAHNLRGQAADPAPLAHELSLYCSEAPIGSAEVDASIFVYLGLKDEVLGEIDPEAWSAAYPAATITLRTYPNGGHDVQYRHLDQILLDIAGYGDKVLVCVDGSEKMVSTDAMGENFYGTLGLCAWSN